MVNGKWLIEQMRMNGGRVKKKVPRRVKSTSGGKILKLEVKGTILTFLSKTDNKGGDGGKKRKTTEPEKEEDDGMVEQSAMKKVK